MTFESSIGKFKQTQSLLFTAVIRKKKLKFEKSIQVILNMTKSENGNISLAFKVLNFLE